MIDGDWMVVAETEEIAQKVVDAADGSTLAGDAAFGEWTSEAGEDGFMSFYLSKAAAQYLDDAASMGPLFGMPNPEDFTTEDPMGAAPEGEVPPELQQMIDDFDGAAATVRFDDGAVEVEYAMSNYQKDITEFVDSEEGAAMVADLPADTVAAMGFSLEEGWGQAMIDYAKTTLSASDGTDIDDEIAQFEDETGLADPRGHRDPARRGRDHVGRQRHRPRRHHQRWTGRGPGRHHHQGRRRPRSRRCSTRSATRPARRSPST